MKRITIVLLLILPFVGYIGVAVYLKLKPQAPAPEAPQTTQNDVIIAPAIIDSLADITRIPTLQSGVIKDIHVKVGQLVKKGEPLFSLNSELIENTRHIQQLNAEETKSNILIQEKHLKHLRHQLAKLKRLDKRAISQSELHDKAHEVNMTNAQLKQAYLKHEQALSDLQNTELVLSQYTTVAPKDGIILQVNTHPNEFVNYGQPILFLGDAKNIIVRVSVDERDAGRFRANSKAELVLSYEDPTLNVPLSFIQLDQYIVIQERLNSRVQEILYAFDRSKHPEFIAGQLFDAKIILNSVS